MVLNNTLNKYSIYNKMSTINKDVLINCLVPYVSYFSLTEVLSALNFTSKEIADIKTAEHARRLKKCNADHVTEYVNIRQVEYRVDNVLHREDGPARLIGTGDNTDYHWYKNDKLHREDGPAIVYSNGTKVWYVDGKQHRDDGPAYEGFDGYLEYWINGRQHNDSGPAVIHINGEKEFWLKGRPIAYVTLEGKVIR